MPDIVDELQLKIDAQVNKSGDLKTLANNLRAMAKHVERLETVGKGGGLDRLTNSLVALSGAKVDSKANGINGLSSALSRLSKASATMDSGRLKEFTATAKKMTKAFAGTSDGVQSAARLFNSIASMSRNSSNMEAAAYNLPILASGLAEFTEAVENMPISDKTLSIVTSVAELSKNSAKLNGNLLQTASSARSGGIGMQILGTAAKSVGSAFKTMLSWSKKIVTALLDLGGRAVRSAIGGIKDLISNLRILKREKNGLDGLGFSIKTLLGTMLGFRGITGLFNWTKAAVSAGADVTEIDHIVKSVFGESMVGAVNEWADNAIEKFGIAATEAKHYAGVLNAMFQASNVGVNDAARMSMDLVGLAGDLAAFYNIDTEDAYKKIQSGMAGMVRPLRSLGIDLSVATLKEYALAQGIEKSYTDMTQAEKVMLRYRYLMEQTSTQQGDFARTSKSLANGLRTLRAYMSAITTQIGVGLASALRHVVVLLNGFMKYVLAAAKAFATFMQTIFGKYEGGASGVAMDLEGIVDDTEGFADGADAAADGLGDAADNAKKLKKELSVLPFDELNQLNKDKESSSSGKGSGAGSGSVGGIGDFGDGLLDFGVKKAESELTEFEQFMNRWALLMKGYFNAKNWEGLGDAIAYGLNNGIKKLYELLDPQNVEDNVFPYIDAFTTTFNSLVDSIEWDLLGRTFGEGINDIVMSVNRLIDPATGIDWGEIGHQLALGVNGLVDEIDFAALGDLFANKFNIFWLVASNFASTFDWERLGEQLATGANNFVGKIDFHAIKTTFTEGINGITKATKTFLDNFKARDFGADLKKLIVGIVDGVKWEEIGDALATLWNKAWEFLAGFISGERSNSGLTVQDAINEKLAIKNGKSLKTSDTSSVGKAIHDLLEGAIKNVSLDDMVTTVSGLALSVVKTISTAIGDKDNWITLGTKVGNAIGDILGTEGLGEEGSKAVNAVTGAVVDFFGSALKGLASHGEDIKENVVEFLSGLNWGSIMTIIGTLAMGKFVAALPMILGAAFIKSAIEKELLTLFGGVASGGTIVDAGKTLFSKLGSSVKTVFSKTGDLAKTLGESVASLFRSVGNTSTVEKAGESIFGSVVKALNAPLAEAGLIALVVEATKKVQNFNETLRGGNGFDTDGGWAIQQYINKLGETKKITGETKDELFHLKEQWENGEMDDESFYSKFGDILKNGGLSADSARGAIDELRGDVGNFSDQDLATLDSAIAGIGTQSETTEQKLSQTGITGEEAYAKVREAVSELETTTNGMVDGGKVQVLLDAFDDGSKDATEALKRVQNSLGFLGIDVDTLRNAINQKFGIDIFDTLTGATETASSKVSGFLGNMKESTDGVSKSIGDLADEAKKIPEDIATGVTHTQGMPSEIISQMSGDMLAKMTLTENGTTSGYETAAEGIPEGGAKGIENKSTVFTDAVRQMAKDGHEAFKDEEDMHSPSRKYEELAYDIPTGVAAGIDAKQQSVVDAISRLSSAMRTEFGKFSITSEIDKMFTGYADKLRTLSTSMRSWGQTIAQSLSNGLQSVNVIGPHVQVTGGNWVAVSTTESVWVDDWNISWYKKGGLFDKPTIAGFGEAGNEAALPLENKRTMGMIADAIVKNSRGGMGINGDEMRDAVATGVAMALAQNPQTAEVVSKVFLQIDGQDLAKAVAREQVVMDQRYNPTPQYG